MKKLIIFFFSTLLLITSCNNSSKNNSKTADNGVQVSIPFPNFDSDSAFHFVKTQTDFGPRVPNTDAHRKCAQFLQNRLEKYCDEVMVQSFTTTTFDGVKINCKNIIGSFAPEKERRVLLAAHWDSRPFADHDPDPANKDKPIDGANDGASGVGVLLEIARQLKEKAPETGVDIIFFDAEDWGTKNSREESGDWWCLGSQYWARNPHVARYRADFGILLDMVGAPNATFLQEGLSMQYAAKIVAKVWSKAYQFGYKNYFVNSAGNHITDDHLYVNKIAKIPMINIIHQDQTSGSGFVSTWHTLQDNISNIDKNTLRIVGTTLLAVIYEEK
jgi:hypothetical protein